MRAGVSNGMLNNSSEISIQDRRNLLANVDACACRKLTNTIIMLLSPLLFAFCGDWMEPRGLPGAGEHGHGHGEQNGCEMGHVGSDELKSPPRATVPLPAPRHI